MLAEDATGGPYSNILATPGPEPKDGWMREVDQFGPMKVPKNRSMPLTTAMVRFVDVAELIKSRSVSDEVLRDLCEDYRLAREALTRLRKIKPRRVAEIAEYTAMVAELEDEVIRHLLGAGEPLDK